MLARYKLSPCFSGSQYAMGEAALVEILEGVCNKGDSRCIEFLDKYEEDIEEW